MITECLIQIGLHLTCEYIYVTRPGWYLIDRRGNYRDEDISIPNVIRNENPWFYYGVDMSEESLEFVKKRYNNEKHCKFIQCLVHNKTDVDITHDGFTTNKQNSESPENKETIKSKTLDLLLTEIEHSVNVIVLDIEGDEYDVLKAYSFNIRPKAFIIESHNYYNTYNLTTLMSSNGYSLIERFETNKYYFRGTSTENLVFLSHEFVGTQHRVLNAINLTPYQTII